jgi:threonine/homoserine/homoserine lactone efflux protein
MISYSHFFVFLTAATLLAVSPGPGMLYVLARSLRGGRRVGSPFGQGVATEVLNPKTALFFLAFIPQFVTHDAPLVPQFLLLGAISVALNTSADVLVVMLAAPLQRRLGASALWRRRQQQASGLALIGLGGYVAVTS